MAIIMGLGLLFYILLGFRWERKRTTLGQQVLHGEVVWGYIEHEEFSVWDPGFSLLPVSAVSARLVSGYVRGTSIVASPPIIFELIYKAPLRSSRGLWLFSGY